ncbi:MAG: hypothetical protein ACXVEX_08790 [Actinomycetota bacterium]
MPCIVRTAVAQVDPSDERDVLSIRVRAVDEDELLMMRAEALDALVEQELTPRFVHELSQVRVLLLAVFLLIGMRAPDQSANVDAAPHGIDQDGSQLGSRPGELLISIAAPIEEPKRVSRAQTRDLFIQARKVRIAVDQGCNAVAFGPSAPVRPSPVDLGGIVPAFIHTEEPSFRLERGGGSHTVKVLTRMSPRHINRRPP